MTKSHIFDSPCAYAAKWCSNGRRGLLKLSSKCTPKHLKPTTKMHSSARYTHGERENRWFHRRRKSNENLNDKIVCFSFPRVRIGLKWSPAPSKKLPKMDQKTAKFYSKTVSGPQLGRPDELGGDRMRVLKLRSSYKTSEQQRSTIDNHRTCIWNFCAPRRWHPRQVEPYLTVIWQKFFHVHVCSRFSQHSGRVKRWLRARLKAEIALDNIPNAPGMPTLQFLTRKCDPQIVI